MGATRNELIRTTPLSGSNAAYVEAVYEQYVADPSSVSQAWRE